MTDAQQSSYSVAVQQVMCVVREELSTQTWPANPFPKGMRPACGTERIYLALLAAHPKWMEHHEIMEAANCSRGAVSWGVRYLAHHGMVRSVGSVRHQSYLRYQAIRGK